MQFLFNGGDMKILSQIPALLLTGARDTMATLLFQGSLPARHNGDRGSLRISVCFQ
jgi:hypothetical protein